MAKLVSVIETSAKRGDGTFGNPYRRVQQWWSTDGPLLAERDPWLDDELLRLTRGEPNDPLPALKAGLRGRYLD